MNMKRIYRLSVAIVMVLIMAGGFTKAYADNISDAQWYGFKYYEYNEVVNNVSPFDWKETNSFIYVKNEASSGSYRVYALGAYGINGAESNYADCSNGYYEELYYNGDSKYLKNYVREWGYNAAGIKGIYMGDEAFEAWGVFATDSGVY